MFCRITYFSTRVEDEPGAASRVLARLADQRVNLLGAALRPSGPRAAVLDLFPADALEFAKAARAARIALEGPHGAVFVQGDDRVGAFAAVLSRLAAAGIEPASAVSLRDGRGRIGCIVPLDCHQLDAALRSLKGLALDEWTEADRAVGKPGLTLTPIGG